MATYDIQQSKVNLSTDWGLSAYDYTYIDVNRATQNPETVKVDFQDLMVRVGSRRAVVVEGEIQPMTVRMRARNKYLAELGEVLAVLTKVQSDFSGDDNGDKSTGAIPITAEQYTLLRRLPAVSQGNLIYEWGGNYYSSKSKMEGLVQAVKGEMDTQNNASQTDMTRLQSLVDTRDDSYSTATNIMSSISETRSNLIQSL